MTSQLRFFSVVLLFAAGFGRLAAQPAAPAEPAHFVFVFHGGKDVAEVFDGATLTRLAAPRVGLGAFRAFGLPGSNDTGAGAKFYVLTPRAVHVLDGSFHETDVISLSLPALPSRRGAALSSDGATLVVATAAGVYLIDTAMDAVAAYLPAGFEVAGVALSTDSGRAYVAAAGTPMLRPLDLSRRKLLDEMTSSPVELETWDRSPNGLRALGLGEEALYAINEAGTVRYQGEIEPLLRAASEGGQWLASRRSAGKTVAAAPNRSRRLEVTDSGRVYVAEDGTIQRESVLGGVSEAVTDSRTNRAVQLSAAGGWDASPSGEAVFVANGTELARVPADPAAPVQSVALLEAGGEVEAVIPRIEQAGTLSLTTSVNMVIAGGTRFQIGLNATGADGSPQSNVPVFISNHTPATPAATCFTAITDASGNATIDCTLGAVTAPTAIQLTVSDTKGRSAPILNIQTVVPTEFEGLALLQGGGDAIPLDIEYLIVAQVSRKRVPVAGETVALTTVPSQGALICPRTAVTDATGKATFVCRSAIELEEGAESVDFTLRDSANNSLTGNVIVDPEAVAPTGLTKVEGDGQLVPQGESVSFVVSSFRDGAPRANTFLNITVLNPGTPPSMTCPTNAKTDAQGIGRFTCKAGTVFGAGIKVQIQVSDFGVTLAEPFEVTVTSSSFGFAQTLAFVSEENLKIPAGRPVLNAIQVKALTSEGGQAVPNTTVYFFPISSGEITIDPPVAKTDSSGIASVTVTVGCNSSPVTFGVGLFDGQALLDGQVSPAGGAFSQVVIVQGDGQSGAPGQPLNAQALVARTTDACGLPLPQQAVTWRVKPAFAATLRNVVNKSDSQARVSALITLGQYGGPFEIEVGSGEVFATFHLAVNLDASELRAVSGGGQVVASGQSAPQPLVVQALGTTGFGVSEIPVQWTVAEGPATITQSTPTTSGAGVAYARVRINGAGTPRVRIQASGLGKAVSFLLNSTDGPQADVAGFTNGASFQTGWTQGGTGSIFGLALADQLVAASTAPFPTNLGGVTVKVNGTLVPLIFVSPTQINLQVPFEATAGNATVEINNNGKLLTVSGVQINPLQPGVFEISVDGKTIAAALHQDSTLIRPSSPAIPGEVVQLFFTGGGSLTPSVATNQPGPVDPLPFTTTPTMVKIGGVEQEGLGSFYAPGLITANQVNFKLAADTPSGDRELILDMNGAVSKTVVLPVGPPAAQ